MFNTLQEMQELVSQGLAVAKYSTTNDLVLFKYSRKAFYDGHLARNEKLQECRGHVYSTTTGKIVQMPFRKSYNYLENNWWSHATDRESVVVYRKHNGFMLSVTNYNDELLVTTTGSFDSDFVTLGRQYLTQRGGLVLPNNHAVTLMYEICATEDPHIVHEEPKAIFLGTRFANGKFYPSSETFVGNMTFGRAKQLVEEDKGEGFMVYHTNDLSMTAPCKLKTPYYSTKKMLMRVKAERLGATLLKVPEKYQNVSKVLRENLHEFSDMPEQDRRVFLERYM